MNNPSTHSDLDPDLWLYGLFNNTAENLWMTHSASTIGCSQLISSTQIPKFTVMLDQQVQARMAHLNEKCE
jgi:hypothetical protein